MKVLGIIPARGGSKRVPGKNKKFFCGKPLVTYTIETAIKTKLIDRVVVNTDDDDILNIASNYKEILAIKRPSSISQDRSPAIDYVFQTMKKMNSLGDFYDIVVILQPTSPLTIPQDIDNTIKLLIESKAQSAVSVMKLDHAIHPVKMKIMNGNKLSPFLEEENGRMAEHELPIIYVRNCSVYASTIDTIEKGIIIGNDCRGYIMPFERSIDINNQIDFDFAEFLYNKYNN